ncbi:MAG: hypothetical protein ACI8X5_000698 [Planctomycetota bacterium]|jgi:hypothetical protein
MVPLWNFALCGNRLLFAGVTLAVQLVTLGGGYLAILRLAEWRGVSLWDSTSFIDRAVPALPWTVLVYMSLYLYFPITMLLAPRGKRGTLAILYHFQAQVLVSLITWAVFLAFPTRIYVRSEMESKLGTSSEFLNGLFAELYSLDAPFNAWPSLHVSLSILMLFTWAQFTRTRVGRHKLWRRGKLDTIAIVIAVLSWLALCLSILTTKQHFFFDIWTGALVGCIAWRFYLRALLCGCELEGVGQP